MAAVYNGIQFNTKLEATWAAFFDLAGWQWWHNPAPVNDWKPDFKVTFECGHSECGGSHTLLISVLAVKSLDGLHGHPALSYQFAVPDSNADGGALFGTSPAATKWHIGHGAGSGDEDVYFRVDNANELWSQALATLSSAK